MFFALAIELGASLVGGVVVGYYLDRAFNTQPWLTVVFFLGGIASGVRIGAFITNKYKKSLREQENVLDNHQEP